MVNNDTASESKKLINAEKPKNSAKMNDDELILRRKKQNADRSRAYRQRKKDLYAMASSAVQSGEAASENIVTAKLLHQKQLNAERCRRYRQRCKQLKSGANFSRGSIGSSTSTSRDSFAGQAAAYSSTISKHDETKENVDYSTDDDDEDCEDNKKLNELRSCVDKLEQQSQNYDRLFKEFGKKVVNRLKSMPVKSAILLQKRLEDVMNEFCSCLNEPTTSDATGYPDVQTKKLKKDKTLQKGKCPEKKSPSQKIDSGTSSIVTGIIANAPSNQVITDPCNQSFTVSSLVMVDQSDIAPASNPQNYKLLDTTGMCISYGIKPQSQPIRSTDSTNEIPEIRPFFVKDSGEDQIKQEQMSFEDDDDDSDSVEIEIKMEPEEVSFKTEYLSDDANDPLNFV